MLDKPLSEEYPATRMRLFFSNKVARLLLSAVISIWMAGGCLFGCSSAMGAEVENSAAAVQSAESCHAKKSHDCCATAKTKKKLIASNWKQLEGVASFVPTSRGMMRDCPLVIGSTAATSKNSTNVPDPGRVPVAALPGFERQTAHTDSTLVRSFLPNGGPTHLRCCVFLI